MNALDLRMKLKMLIVLLMDSRDVLVYIVLMNVINILTFTNVRDLISVIGKIIHVFKINVKD